MGRPGGGPAGGSADGAALFLAAVEETSDAVGAIRAVRDAGGAHIGDAIVYLNGTIRRRWLAGASLESVVGADPYLLMPMLGALRAHSREVVETREPHRSVERLEAPGGRSIWIDLRMEPWGDGFLFFSKDVTAEHAAVAAAEATVALRDALLRDALGALGDLVLVVTAIRDETGTIVDEEIVYANPAWRREFLGSVDLDPTGRTLADAAPAIFARIDEHRDVIETGRPFRRTVALRGHERVHDVAIVRLGDGVVVVARDAMERVDAERALRESEARFRLLAENASDIVFRSSVAGVFEWVSPSIERVLGWRAEDAVGRWVFDYIHPDDATRIAQEGAPVARGEETAFEGRYRRIDGTYRWLSVRSRPVRDAEGHVIARIGSARDVEAEHAVLDALRASEADLAEAQRIAHVGSYVLRPATGAVEWTAEVYRILGLPVRTGPVSLEDQHRLLGPDIASRRAELTARLLGGGDPFEAEFDVQRADGAIRRLVTRAEPVRDDSGELVAVRGTVTDVTDVREAQARLDLASRAEVVGRLAAGVAHDFNNLLAAISGTAELLLASLADDDPRREDVGAILEAGSRGALLTRQLLAFGRRQPLEASVLDPDAVVDGLVPMLRSLIPATIGLAVEHVGPARSIRADRAQLEQSIVNLVLNARDALRTDGRIEVVVDVVDVAALDPRLRAPAGPGRYVRIAVGDTGTGIDPETLAHIFEPFFTTKGAGEGSGLGLSSVDGFVVQSGGFVAVDSEPGRGSTFAIHLPVLREPAASDVAAAEVPGAGVVGGNERILVVEDEPGVRSILGRMLRELGYTVFALEVPGGALAAIRATENPFHLLLTDVVMPGMDGRELARAARAERPDLAVLLVSGYAPDAGAAGADEFGRILEKPFAREELAARVREALDGRPRAGGGDAPA